MTDPYSRGPGQGEPYPYGDSGYQDPAYGVPYAPAYQPPHVKDATRQLPPYEYGYDPYGTGTYASAAYGQPDEPPPRPPSRRWLWVLATGSLLTVLGLIIAVVIIDSSSQQTVVAPPPTLQPDESSTPTTTTRTPTTTSRPRTTTPRPTDTTPSGPVVPTVPSQPSGPAQTVVYDVSGTGRAISITYVDAGGILQTEFNVMLPWSKQVELSDPDSMASVNIINFGREITCSITVSDEQVESNTGAGLTICGALR